MKIENVDPLWTEFRAAEKEARVSALIDKLEPLLLEEELQTIVDACDELSTCLKKIIKKENDNGRTE